MALYLSSWLLTFWGHSLQQLSSLVRMRTSMPAGLPKASLTPSPCHALPRYEEVYEPLTDRTRHYIKLIDMCVRA
jgi:hypothetical protein